VNQFSGKSATIDGRIGLARIKAGVYIPGRGDVFAHSVTAEMLRLRSRAIFISFCIFAMLSFGIGKLTAQSNQSPQVSSVSSSTTKPAKTPAKETAKTNLIQITQEDSLWVPYARNDSIFIESPGEGYLIRISKGTRRLTLFKDGVPQKVYPVGVGKNKKDKTRKDDNATPEGLFHIESIHDSKEWRYKGSKVYGPWFLRVNTREGAFSGGSWTGIGIHGTSNEKSIGNFVSLGCIRMFNKDILELKEIVAAAMESSQVRVLIIP